MQGMRGHLLILLYLGQYSHPWRASRSIQAQHCTQQLRRSNWLYLLTAASRISQGETRHVCVHLPSGYRPNIMSSCSAMIAMYETYTAQGKCLSKQLVGHAIPMDHCQYLQS